MADPHKTEYQFGISRCFDYDGNLKEQWLRASADTMEELETAYAILTQGVLAWPITLTGDKAPQEPPEPPQDEAEGQPAAKPQENIRTAPKRPQRGTGLPSERQCNAILAICHGLDNDAVETFFKKHPDVELYVHEDGHLVPSWASLQALGSHKAYNMIDALRAIE